MSNRTLQGNYVTSGRRELWQPDEQAQLWAIETLLASSIPSELRKALREREAEMNRSTDHA